MLTSMPTQDSEQAAQMLEDEGIRANVQARLVRERTIERLQQIALANHEAGVTDDVTDDAEDSIESDEGETTENTEDSSDSEE